MRIICSLRQILMCEMLSFRSIFADYVNYSFVQNYIFLTKNFLSCQNYEERKFKRNINMALSSSIGVDATAAVFGKFAFANFAPARYKFLSCSYDIVFTPSQAMDACQAACRRHRRIRSYRTRLGAV